MWQASVALVMSYVLLSMRRDGDMMVNFFSSTVPVPGLFFFFFYFFFTFSFTFSFTSILLFLFLFPFPFLGNKKTLVSFLFSPLFFVYHPLLCRKVREGRGDGMNEVNSFHCAGEEERGYL